VDGSPYWLYRLWRCSSTVVPERPFSQRRLFGKANCVTLLAAEAVYAAFFALVRSAFCGQGQLRNVFAVDYLLSKLISSLSGMSGGLTSTVALVALLLAAAALFMTLWPCLARIFIRCAAR
jgi:hypothetical protein